MIDTKFVYPPFAGAEDVVQAFIEKARGYDVEILQAVDDNGKIVCTNIGDSHSVDVPDAAPGHWLMHSHARSSAPLSMQDVMVVSAHKVKMNMAVCHDGQISWTTGFKNKGMRMCAAVDMFLDTPSVQGRMMAYDMLVGEGIGGPALNWCLLDFFINREQELQDLYIKAGTDARAWEFVKNFNMPLPRTFSYTTDNMKCFTLKQMELEKCQSKART